MTTKTQDPHHVTLWVGGGVLRRPCGETDIVKVTGQHFIGSNGIRYRRRPSRTKRAGEPVGASKGYLSPDTVAALNDSIDREARSDG
jgi:hypothetical protein